MSENNDDARANCPAAAQQAFAEGRNSLTSASAPASARVRPRTSFCVSVISLRPFVHEILVGSISRSQSGHSTSSVYHPVRTPRPSLSVPKHLRSPSSEGENSFGTVCDVPEDVKKQGWLLRGKKTLSKHKDWPFWRFQAISERFLSPFFVLLAYLGHSRPGRVSSPQKSTQNAVKQAC